MADYYGYNFPFFNNGEILPPQADLRLIKNDVKQLLLTSPGERVMRPDYGTIIRKTPFEQFDDNVLIDLRDSISTALRLYEPRVIFRDVIFTTNEDTNYLELVVYMSLSRDPNIELSVAISTVPSNQSQPLQGG